MNRKHCYNSSAPERHSHKASSAVSETREMILAWWVARSISLFNWISPVSSFANDMLWTPSWFQVQCHVAIPDPSVACQLLKSSKSYQQSATGRPEGATTTTDYNSPTRSVSSFQMFLSHWRAANLDLKPILHKPSLACETKPRQMNPRLLRTSPLRTALRLLTFGIGLSINASGWRNYVDLHLTMYAAKSWASSWQS